MKALKLFGVTCLVLVLVAMCQGGMFDTEINKVKDKVPNVRIGQ